jgi:hypothetical protein
MPGLPLTAVVTSAQALVGSGPIPDEADARRIMQIVLGDHSVEFETKHWNLDKVCWFCPIGFSQFLMRKGEIPTRV